MSDTAKLCIALTDAKENRRPGDTRTMTTKIVRRDKVHGAPMGAYSVYYYRVGKDGSLKEEAGFDRSVSVDYVDSLSPKENEVCLAICESHGAQPRVLVFGSARAESAWDLSEEASP